MSDYYFLASRLKSRVTFRKKEKVRQPDGSLEEVWADYRSTWAEVITIGGEEGRTAAANSSSVRFRITLRHRTDIDESMVVFVPAQKRDIEILSIRDPDGRGVFQEINGVWKQGGVHNG